MAPRTQTQQPKTQTHHRNPWMAALALAAVVALGGTALAQSGMMSPQQRPALGMGGGPQAMFTALDRNQDGQLTQAEIKAHQDARFGQMDRNGDGVLSTDEMAPPRGQGPNGRPSMMQGMDKNNDGTITRDEFRAFEGHRLDQADQNHDGIITQTEFENSMPRRGPRS